MLLDLIVGARPNFIKISSIVRALLRRDNINIKFRLVHTGQHYDNKMSGDFFRQLNIPMPDVNLNCGSGTQAEQTASIMIGYENLLRNSPCDMCLVVGDVNSTLACALVAKKENILVSHVEAGIRSGDMTMPEEINRIVTDSISDYFFTTTKTAGENLLKFGVRADRIHLVGNTMIDTLLHSIPHFTRPDFFDSYGLVDGRYYVLTMHRPSNVDQGLNFMNFLNILAKAASDFPIIFPVHPRTAARIKSFSDFPLGVIMVDPQPYYEFNYLVQRSRAVITDSGGISEETTVLGVPCLTMRDSTERPETVEIGSNCLIGSNYSALDYYLTDGFLNSLKGRGVPYLWDGFSGDRIIDVISHIFSHKI